MLKLSIGLLLVFGVMLFIVGASPKAAYAQDPSSSCQVRNFFGFPPWYKYLDFDEANDCAVQSVRYTDGTINIGATAGRVLLALTEILLRVAGVVAVGFVIYGGVSYTISQGVPEKTVASRNILLNGLIGLVIASLAVVIVNLVGNLVT